MPTSDADTVTLLRARNTAAAAGLAADHARIRSRLPVAVARLRAEFGVGRVWLFGSRVVGTVHAESDVDLAVEGLDRLLLHRAHARVEDVLRWAIDLVRLEEAEPALRDRVLREGELL